MWQGCFFSLPRQVDDLRSQNIGNPPRSQGWHWIQNEQEQWEKFWEMWKGDVLKDLWEEPLNADWFSISTFPHYNCFSLFGADLRDLCLPFPVAGEFLVGSLSSLSGKILPGGPECLWILPLGIPGPGIAALAGVSLQQTELESV